MIWHPSVNQTDTKQFFNLLSPQLEWNLWMKINSVEHEMHELHEFLEHLKCRRDECRFIIKKFHSTFFSFPSSDEKKPFNISQLMRIVIMKLNNLIFIMQKNFLEF